MTRKYIYCLENVIEIAYSQCNKKGIAESRWWFVAILERRLNWNYENVIKLILRTGKIVAFLIIWVIKLSHFHS